MAAKLTRQTHKVAIQLHLVAQSCTICSSCSRQSVWKLFDVPLYMVKIWILSLPREKLLVNKAGGTKLRFKLMGKSQASVWIHPFINVW